VTSGNVRGVVRTVVAGNIHVETVPGVLLQVQALEQSVEDGGFVVGGDENGKPPEGLRRGKGPGAPPSAETDDELVRRVKEEKGEQGVKAGLEQPPAPPQGPEKQFVLLGFHLLKAPF
jgi:hypothetical protein